MQRTLLIFSFVLLGLAASFPGWSQRTVRHLQIDTMEQKQISALITRRMASGNNATFGYFEMQKGGIVPLHHHVNEQYTFILRGSVRVTIGGKIYIVKAGEAILIPSNVPHLFECLEDGTIDLDFFAPGREDWINGTDNYFKSNTKDQ